MREFGIAGHRACAEGPHHDPRAVRHTGAGPVQAGLHRRRRPNLQVRRRHHLPARSATASSSTWRPCWTASAAGWSAGRSPTTCAPSWSPTPCGRPPRPAAAWPARSSTPTTGRSTPPRTSPTSAHELGVTQSMGAVGTSADNAACESFNATLKRETLQGAHRWPGDAHLPPRGLPLAHPLQHPPPALRQRPPQPHRTTNTSTSSSPLNSRSPHNQHERVSTFTGEGPPQLPFPAPSPCTSGGPAPNQPSLRLYTTRSSHA